MKGALGSRYTRAPKPELLGNVALLWSEHALKGNSDTGPLFTTHYGCTITYTYTRVQRSRGELTSGLIESGRAILGP